MSPKSERKSSENAEEENVAMINCRVEGEGKREEGHEKNEESERRDALTELIQEILGPEEDTQCGLGRGKSGEFQRLATPVTYLVLSSAAALVQGMFYTYANATLSTIERRFRLPSKVSAFVTTGNDLVQLFLGIPLAYAAGRGHRPRWLALSMLGAAAACLLASSPHFIFGTGDLASSVTQNDLTDANEGLCKRQEEQQNGAGGGAGSNYSNSEGGINITTEQYTVVTLHFLAQVLAGVASLMYYTIGHTYLDDAVRKDKVPLFLAISGCVRILGPVCAYSLASWCLSMWLDPSLEPPLPPRHPQWIGAWWIGYLVIGACLGLEAWLLGLLPKTLPGARLRVARELQEAEARGGLEEVRSLAATLRPTHLKPFRGLAGGMWRLITNKVYMLTVVNQSIFWFAFIGYITFKPKFLEHQFKMSAARANQYIAGAALAATLAGWLMTGSTLTLLKPRSRSVLVFMSCLSLLNCLLHLTMVNVSCDREVIHGMDSVLMGGGVPSHNSSRVEGELMECVRSCRCTPKFSPVCVDGRETFYSACFAGCTSSTLPFTSLTTSNTTDVTITFTATTSNVSTSITTTTPKKVYEKCSCVAAIMNTSSQTYPSATLSSTSSADWSGVPSAVDGYCTHECPAFYMYLILSVLTKMTLAASRVPVNIILFRCVEPRDKDLGLGVFNSALALAAFIPAPIVFGWAIDSACRLWEESSGSRGYCWLYDIDAFRKILHGIPAGLMALCFLTEVALIFLHKSIHLYGSANKKPKVQEKWRCPW